MKTICEERKKRIIATWIFNIFSETKAIQIMSSERTLMLLARKGQSDFFDMNAETKKTNKLGPFQM